MHHSLLHMGLHSYRPVRVPMMPTAESMSQWACEPQNWTMEQWNNVAWSDETHFLLDQVNGRVLYMCIVYLGKKWQPDALWVEGLLSAEVL